MWQNILKGTAILTAIMTILATLGVAAVNHELKKSLRHPLDDDDVM